MEKEPIVLNLELASYTSYDLRNLQLVVLVVRWWIWNAQLNLNHSTLGITDGIND